MSKVQSSHRGMSGERRLIALCGVAVVAALSPASRGQPEAWMRGGNVGGTDSTVLGTTDNAPLVLMTNNLPVLTLQYTNQLPIGGINVLAGHAAEVGSAAVGCLVVGGQPMGGRNIAYSRFASILGGVQNFIGSSSGVFPGDYSVVAGGQGNGVTGNHCGVLSGAGNGVYGDFCSISGGQSNNVGGCGWTGIFAGQNNRTETCTYSAVLGGERNFIRANHSVIGGGALNTVELGSLWSFIGGGRNNRTFGQCASVIGGWANTARGNYSCAGGYQATAEHTGCFVWSSGQQFGSTEPGQFLVNAVGVGINTNAPRGAMEILSNGLSTRPQLTLTQSSGDFARLGFRSTGTSRYFNIASNTAGATPAADRINCYHSSAGNMMTLTGDGRVGIGNANPGAYKLDVNGSIRCTGLTQTSSARYKSSIAPISNVLDRFSQLRPVAFTWDNDHGGERDLGLIAEEVGALFPEAVVTDAEGQTEGINYSRLTALAIQALKESGSHAQAQERKHGAELAALRAQHAAQHAALLARIERLESLEHLDQPRSDQPASPEAGTNRTP